MSYLSEFINRFPENTFQTYELISYGGGSSIGRALPLDPKDLGSNPTEGQGPLKPPDFSLQTLNPLADFLISEN